MAVRENQDCMVKERVRMDENKILSLIATVGEE